MLCLREQLYAQGEGPEVSRQPRAAGRHSYQTQCDASGLGEALVGHLWAHAKAWEAAEAKLKLQLKLRNHQDFPAAE